MKTRSTVIIVLQAILILALSVYIYVLKSENAGLRTSAVSLGIGGKIDYFTLTGIDGNAVDASDIHTFDNKIFCIFIFERPCSPCNKNIVTWNKIKSTVDNNSRVFGVILEGRDQMTDFSISRMTKFDLFTPVDREEFLKRLNIKMNLPQTILYQNGKIVYIKLGELLTDDFFQIKRIINRT